MLINLKESLGIILAIAGIIAIGYRISKVEAAIYQAIDKIQDEIVEELRLLQRDFSVSQANYAARKEWQDSVIHQLNEKIDHKFNRLHENQKDIQRYLAKDGFKVRQFGQVDPES